MPDQSYKWRVFVMVVMVLGFSAPLSAATFKDVLEHAWSNQAQTARSEQYDAQLSASQAWVPEPPTLTISYRGDQIDTNNGLREWEAEISQPIWLWGQRDRAQSVANTAGSLLTSEKAAQEQLVTQIKRLEAENRELRDNLGFFEKLLPTAATDGVVIRGLQAELLAGSQLKWQVLIMQPAARATEFTGRLEITVDGLQNGKPWTTLLPGGLQALQLRQYRRLEGLIDVPAQTVVKTVTAKVFEGNNIRAVQTFKF